MGFLEREPQMAAMLGYAAEAAAGTGRLVLLEGEAGVGKSTLLEQLEDRVDGDWCWGACDGMSTPRPLAPLHDIAQQLAGELLAACRSGASRDDLFAAFLATLQDRTRLTVLVFEDIHWADQATLDLLSHLGRRIQRLPALLLASFREEGGGTAGPLRAALGDLSRQRATRRVTLPLLTYDAVAAIVAGSGLDAAQVHRLTAGNPYFVTELLQTPVGELPASARDAVLSRVATLSADARELVEVAALTGTRVDHELLGDLTSAPSSAWDELVDAGLLVVEGRSPRFRHEIARLAVADSVLPHRSIDLHTQVLRRLVERGCTDDARLAFHAEEAGDAAAVVAYAGAAAARAATLKAHREAVEHYRQALRFVDPVDDRTRASLTDGLAGELSVIDHWEESESHWAESVVLWGRVGDQHRLGDALRWQSKARWRLSRGEEAAALLESALAVLEPLGPSPELARAVKDRAGFLMGTSDHEEAIETATRAIELAEALELPDVLSDALNTLACSLCCLEQPWIPTMQRALAIALEHGCTSETARVYTNYYGCLIDSQQLAAGERVFLDGAAFCDDHDAATFGNCLRASRAEALEAQGRWDEALDLARTAIAHEVLSPMNELHYQLSLSRISSRRGAPEAADLLSAGVTTALSSGEPQWIVPFVLARAEWHWFAGRVDEAADDVRLAVEQAGHAWLAREAAVWAARLGIRAADPAGAGTPASTYDAALALLDRPDPDGWLDALTQLDALGAAPAAALTRRRLRDAGVRSVPNGVRATTRTHPAGLTTREQEVLDRLCEGMTNDQIATSLYISVKTAGHHVSAVLSKLGVHSRQEAVAEATARGLGRRDGEPVEAT